MVSNVCDGGYPGDLSGRLDGRFTSGQSARALSVEVVMVGAAAVVVLDVKVVVRLAV